MRKITFYVLASLIVLVLLIIAPFMVESGFLITIMYTLFIYTALAESWNIIGGMGGQVFLGTAAFFGWGAYACAMLSLSGLPFLLCVFLGGLTTVFLAIVLTPTFKLRGTYFVVGSIFLSEIMKVIVLMLPVTGGATGIMLPIFRERVIFTYYVSMLLMLAAVLSTYLIVNSKIGTALKAIRDDQDAAEMFGVNSTKVKLFALLSAAVFCGMIGGIHAFYMIYVEPHSFFDIHWSLIPVFMVLIGGSSTLAGPIIGVAIYTLLRELFVAVSGEIYLTMLGILLIAVMLLAPNGLYPFLEEKIKKLRRAHT